MNFCRGKLGQLNTGSIIQLCTEGDAWLESSRRTR